MPRRALPSPCAGRARRRVFHPSRVEGRPGFLERSGPGVFGSDCGVRAHDREAAARPALRRDPASTFITCLGLAVAIGAGLFQELVLPGLNERGDEVDRIKIRGQAPRHLQSRQRFWVRSAASRFYRVELLNPGTNDLYGVTILEIDHEFGLVGRLDARRAHWTASVGS